ncbi:MULTISPECIES: metalloregulator ArsR/SmtB family transcription factor [Pseudoalteromonas]|uniref:Metalloregulator ArsR/SmtB family transcription factor n=1 Tax=Pseudoalteromonas arctica TaxID=394751 RepID=A0A7X9YF97_9GAMM|nr:MULTISPECIES: metalloregulator ArsR/SmtB family transcription factor [Pseudoalteromonas]MBH0018697.1 metalloregulator ArsR/SmtB family transcription factor [Pseudoalteromonas sp. NGC95]MBH0047526.1 metalloregulator ArsR/SmtB family transcription factor [Pseudoalteromonas sp. NZS11_1]MBH0063430.1 metalloregulator ArsR/SmtB family transcription factor [Pseudoalteromonas sp. NZS71]NMF47446.1 metalloregulator ArsR/SmtB family transcription factor [Pseudoalteromonas arctica]NMP03874.1 metalloreg
MEQFNPLQFYKCLADDTRLKAMLLISHEEELCVCELVAALKLSQPKVSRHLAQLRQCGLLSDRKQNQWVYYSINKALPEWAKNVLTQTLTANSSFYQNDLTRLNAMGNRPERAASCCN